MDDERFESIPIAEWERLEGALRAWCDGPVEADDAAIDCRAGAARFRVTRDGRVEAGMPLHELSREGVDAVGVDPDGRALLLSGEGVRYVFRHP
jgi:hypothetical protein